jgi:hypothetical protein
MPFATVNMTIESALSRLIKGRIDSQRYGVSW